MIEADKVTEVLARVLGKLIHGEAAERKVFSLAPEYVATPGGRAIFVPHEDLLVPLWATYYNVAVCMLDAGLIDVDALEKMHEE